MTAEMIRNGEMSVFVLRPSASNPDVWCFCPQICDGFSDTYQVGRAARQGRSGGGCLLGRGYQGSDEVEMVSSGP